MSLIIKNLYICSAADAKNLKFLQNLGITHVVNLAANIPPQHSEHFVYLKVDAHDKSDFNISQFWDQIGDFIEQAIQGGGSVMVHCHQGISRAPITVMAYLIVYKNMDQESAKQLLLRQRPQIEPNEGFLEQLDNYVKNKNLILKQKSNEKEDKEQEHQNYQGDQNEFIKPSNDKFIGFQKESKQIFYKCKQCKNQLFTNYEILHQKENNNQCQSIFTKQPKWLLDYGEITFRIYCIKCQIKLGDVNISGQACACGQWVAPGIQFFNSSFLENIEI